MADSRTRRLRMPLMAAFRDANQVRDAKTKIDERDESGERVIAGRRATGRSVITEAQLQRTVARDLEQLMNTINLDSSLDLDGYALAQTSVINYGFPDVVHRTIDEGSVGDIGYEIQQALSVYETRLIPDSITVRRDTSIDDLELKVRFLVRADLRSDPLNVPVEFVADLDRDTGKISIRKV